MMFGLKGGHLSPRRPAAEQVPNGDSNLAIRTSFHRCDGPDGQFSRVNGFKAEVNSAMHAGRHFFTDSQYCQAILANPKPSLAFTNRGLGIKGNRLIQT